MENILTKYLQNTAHAEAFTVLEQELAKLIIVTVEHGECIAIKKSLLDRLAKVEPDLLELKNVYTFEDRLSEMLLKHHPLSKLIPTEERKLLRRGTSQSEKFELYGYMINEKLPIFRFNISLISELTKYLSIDHNEQSNQQFIDYIEYSLVLDFFSHLVSSSIDTSGLFYDSITEFNKSNHLYLHHHQLSKQYSDILKSSNNNLKTEKQSLLIIQELYNKKIKYALYPILRNIYQNDIAYLLGVFLDIANMNNNELAKFTSGYYTDIPYFANNSKPVTALVDRTESMTGIRTELLIRGENEAVHLVFDQHGIDVILKFDKYLLSDGETVYFRGEPILLDNDCLIGENLTVIKWLLFSNNTSIYSEIQYKHEPIIELAMSGLTENDFTLYLQDRNGLHHRWK